MKRERDNSKYDTAGSHFGIVVTTGDRPAVAVGNGRAETLT